MERNFRLERNTDGRAVVLTLHGELDVSSSAQLESELNGIDATDHAVIDLRSLEFIDSTGLGLLVRSHQRLEQAGGSLTIVGGGNNGQVQRLFAMTGLGERLHVVADMDDALAAE